MDDINYKAIGTRIREVRKLRRMKQEHVVALTGISLPHYSNIETGKTKLSVNCLMKIVNALEATPSELLMDAVPVAKSVRLKMLETVLGNCSDRELDAFLKLWAAFQSVEEELHPQMEKGMM